ncbi:MAG: hypothetical protein OEZ06_30430 [Myxococcales bacterium]|nr:hypothetical protein [Myxococcales bacterium]
MLLLANAIGCASEGLDDGLGSGCDILTKSCQQSVLEATARAREQSDFELPAVRTIEAQQLGDELRKRAEAHIDQLEAVNLTWTSALHMLGLLSPEANLVDAMIGDLQKNVVAYYDPETKEVTLLQGSEAREPLEGVNLLAHEFAHALQDQESDLTDFRQRWIDSNDSQVAVDSLIEGEAVVVAATVLDNASGPNREFDWDGLAYFFRRDILAAIENSNESLLTASHQLPYTLGTTALIDTFRERGGPDRVRAIYGAPPTTAHDWLFGAIDVGPRRQRLLTCFPTRGPEGEAALAHDTLGIAGVLGLALTLGEPIDVAWSVAGDWRDDSLVVFADAYGEAARGVAWRIRVNGEVRPGLAGGVVVRLPDTAVRRDGLELMYLAAADPDLLAAWNDSFTCGQASELPDGETAGTGMAALRRWALHR